MHLSPAEYVIHVFGGVRATARALSREPSTISKWQSYVDKKGQKGQIPTSLQKTILEKAKDLNLELTAEDLIYGKDLTRKEALR